ncbi:HVO_2142 family zinc finger protein (plasmid) [Haloferax sp. S1W]|uniref:HVO_2142 family zinc finger protein n=1 Tax=Haloferax sp. S1W TaxID=3377110 RepID=UPI0037CA76AC
MLPHRVHPSLEPTNTTTNVGIRIRKRPPSLIIGLSPSVAACPTREAIQVFLTVTTTTLSTIVNVINPYSYGRGMSTDHAQDGHSEWCPDCGAEMLFSGVQPAGMAQFFCKHCRYRRDRFVGTD